VSVAFTKEESSETAAETMLPDRPVSEHPNLVTLSGLKKLQAELDSARAAYEAANSVEDVNERRRQQAAPVRDVRYYAERVRSAELIPDPETHEAVSFGSTVTYTRDERPAQTYRIVGEDEADPKTGSISFASPVARALMGKAVGDVVEVGEQDLEIISIA